MTDWFAANGAGKSVDVEALLDSGAPTVVASLVGLGALVSLGVTSDGGALGVTVTLDGRWRREYFRESEELVSWLLEAQQGVTAALDAQDASSAPRTRPRRRQKAT